MNGVTLEKEEKEGAQRNGERAPRKVARSGNINVHEGRSRRSRASSILTCLRVTSLTPCML